MSLTEDERKAVVLLRLNNARQTLEDAKIIANNKLWKGMLQNNYTFENCDQHRKTIQRMAFRATHK